MEPSSAGSSAKPGEHLRLVEPPAHGPDDVVTDRNPIREDDPQQRVAVDDEVTRGRGASLDSDRAAGVARTRRRLARAATRPRLRRRARNPMRLPPMSSQCGGALELPSALRTHHFAGRLSLCRHFRTPPDSAAEALAHPAITAEGGRMRV